MVAKWEADTVNYWIEEGDKDPMISNGMMEFEVFERLDSDPINKYVLIEFCDMQEGTIH